MSFRFLERFFRFLWDDDCVCVPPPAADDDADFDGGVPDVAFPLLLEVLEMEAVLL